MTNCGPGAGTHLVAGHEYDPRGQQLALQPHTLGVQPGLLGGAAQQPDAVDELLAEVHGQHQGVGALGDVPARGGQPA